MTSLDIVFDPPSPVENDTAVTFNATIHNIGDLGASDVIVRFYDGDPGDPVGSGPGKPIDSDKTITAISARSYGYAEISWTATPTGIGFIYVVIDPDNNITESNETNNVANNDDVQIDIIPSQY